MPMIFNIVILLLIAIIVVTVFIVSLKKGHARRKNTNIK